MKYEAPELKVIRLDAVDVIQTSGIVGGAGGENETPMNPNRNSLDLDENY